MDARATHNVNCGAIKVAHVMGTKYSMLNGFCAAPLMESKAVMAATSAKSRAELHGSLAARATSTVCVTRNLEADCREAIKVKVVHAKSSATVTPTSPS